MHVETLQNVPSSEKTRYLRVATISSKAALCYFYIGSDNNSLSLLSTSFLKGFAAETLEEAKQMLRSSDLQLIDVIVMDVPYSEKEFNDFHSFLRNREHHFIPIIYNDCHSRNSVTLRENQLIDDVIDLCNW